MNFVFGTIIAMLSFVRMTVLRARIILHLTRHARDFHAVADGDRPFRQDDEAADEIARDILQPESDAHADRAGENGERAEMNAGVLEHDENADDQDEVADDLRDGVLQRAIEPAVDEKAVEEKSLRPRRKPKDRDEQRDQEEDLNETERDSRQRRSPAQRNAGGVDRGDGEEDERGNAQDRGDDRDEVCVELEAREETPDRVALEQSRGDETDERKGPRRPSARGTRRSARPRKRAASQQIPRVHSLESVPLAPDLQLRNKKTRPKPCFSHVDAIGARRKQRTYCFEAFSSMYLTTSPTV